MSSFKKILKVIFFITLPTFLYANEIDNKSIINKLFDPIFPPIQLHNDIIFFFKYHKNMVGVAQLVRAPVCGTGGRGFNPLRPPHIPQGF